MFFVWMIRLVKNQAQMKKIRGIREDKKLLKTKYFKT